MFGAGAATRPGFSVGKVSYFFANSPKNLYIMCIFGSKVRKCAVLPRYADEYLS